MVEVRAIYSGRVILLFLKNGDLHDYSIVQVRVWNKVIFWGRNSVSMCNSQAHRSKLGQVKVFYTTCINNW